MCKLSVDQVKEKVEEYVSDNAIKSPQGRCLDHSYNLSKELGLHASIQFGYLAGEQHTWVEYFTSDGVRLLIDVTARQFGEKHPRVLVGESSKLVRKYGYEYDTE